MYIMYIALVLISLSIAFGTLYNLIVIVSDYVHFLKYSRRATCVLGGIQKMENLIEDINECIEDKERRIVEMETGLSERTLNGLE
jgi:hypothetical protein